MIKGTTESGFASELADSAMDNMELVDALGELDEGGHPFAMCRVCRLLLGEEQRKRLYDHLRTEEGNVPIKALGTEIMEILRGSGDAGKNSAPSPE